VEVHRALPAARRAGNRSWLTGLNAVQMFEEEWGPGSAIIAPGLSVDEGIGAARWLLEQKTTRFHARCDEVPKDADLSGLGTLAEYKYAWDETHKVFSKSPLHNFASHRMQRLRPSRWRGVSYAPPRPRHHVRQRRRLHPVGAGRGSRMDLRWGAAHRLAAAVRCRQQGAHGLLW
jgi:hypothetical protein